MHVYILNCVTFCALQEVSWQLITCVVCSEHFFRMWVLTAEFWSSMFYAWFFVLLLVCEYLWSFILTTWFLSCFLFLSDCGCYLLINCSMLWFCSAFCVLKNVSTCTFSRSYLSFILRFVFCALQNVSTSNWFLKFHILTCILPLECEWYYLYVFYHLRSDFCSDFPASQEVSDFRWLLVFYVLMCSVLQDVSASASLLTSVMFNIFPTLCSQDVSVMWWLIFLIWCFCALQDVSSSSWSFIACSDIGFTFVLQDVSAFTWLYKIYVLSCVLRWWVLSADYLFIFLQNSLLFFLLAGCECWKLVTHFKSWFFLCILCFLEGECCKSINYIPCFDICSFLFFRMWVLYQVDYFCVLTFVFSLFI